MEKYQLRGWFTFQISGTDTVVFLDNLIPLDLQNLPQNIFSPSMFLNPKGKIRSIFYLIKLNSNKIRLITTAEYKANLVEDLLKYNINVDIKLEDLTDEVGVLNCRLIRQSSEEIHDEYFPIVHSMEVFLGWEEKSEAEVNFDLSLYLLKKNKPAIRNLLDINPIEAGFSDEINLDKGCFLGQEPLARMVNRGKPRYKRYTLITNTLMTVLDENQGVLISKYQITNDEILLDLLLKDKTVNSMEGSESFKLELVGTYPTLRSEKLFP